jgi:hypothetical protein
MLTEEDLDKIYEKVKPNLNGSNYFTDYDRAKDYGMKDLLRAIKEKLKDSNRCHCWKCMGLSFDPYAEDEDE